MDTIILITGQTKYQINLDPAIFTFDERKFALADQIPDATGTAIPLRPFLVNAEPDRKATTLICHRKEAEPIRITMDQAFDALLCFAIDDQPIRDRGPVLLYLADGSNAQQPIDSITKLEISLD